MNQTLEVLAAYYQSRRVARDKLNGRNVEQERWWWWDATENLHRLEAERARQAAQQDDAVRRP